MTDRYIRGSMPGYYRINTNRDHFDDGHDGTRVYDEGIVATFGSYEKYGEPLESLSTGDIVFSYVDSVGYRAVGRVLEPFEATEVDPENALKPGDSPEYHVPVEWEAVVDSGNAIEYTEANQILGYDLSYVHRGTVNRIRDRDSAAEELRNYLIAKSNDEHSLFIAAEGDSRTNIDRTVGQPVSAETVRENSSLEPEGDEAYLWGIETERGDLEKDDWLLFSAKAEFPFAAQIIDDYPAPALGDIVFEPTGNNDYDHLILITEPIPTTLSRRQFQKLADYHHMWSAMNFGKVSEEPTTLLRRKFGSLEGFIETIAETAVPDRYERYSRQLEETNQLLFHGPPGTGKTYHADQFAEWWVSEHPETVQTNDQVVDVTFHPSFSYEDFIEGLTATSEDGQIAYEIDDGVFKTFVESVRQWEELEEYDSDDFDNEPRYLFLIDEINRGDVAQIFGELITLLESDKREGAENAKEIELAHSGTSFSIPPNVYLIGTMNTADRSIALVDAALRRRFGFVHFPPDYGELREHYEFDSPAEVQAAYSQDDLEGLQALSIGAVQAINETIRNERDLGRGKQIGHTYLRDRNSPEEVVAAWKYQILPLLEEYYFGDFASLQKSVFDETHEMDALFDWEHAQIRPTFTTEPDAPAVVTPADEAAALRDALRAFISNTDG